MANETVVIVSDPNANKLVEIEDRQTLVTVHDPLRDNLLEVLEGQTSVSVSGTDVLVTIEETNLNLKVETQPTSTTTPLITEHIVVVPNQEVQIVDIAIQGPQGPPSMATDSFEFTLDPSMLSNETSPGVVRVNLPVGKSLSGAALVTGYIDGRLSSSGRGWQPSTDLMAIEIYVPTDTPTRNMYLSANVEYRVTWAK